MDLIDLTIKEKLTYDSLRKILLEYKNKGFGWRRTGSRGQVFGPTSVYDSENLHLLVEHYEHTKLRFGDKSQIEDLAAIDLFNLLIDPVCHQDFWDSMNIT